MSRRVASVVPAKYRERYEDGSCGDTLSTRLKKHITIADGTTDVDKLQALAKRNGVWSAKYAKLNVGMARMNVGNRLSKLTRDGTRWTQPLALHMSAFGGKADMPFCGAHVCF